MLEPVKFWYEIYFCEYFNNLFIVFTGYKNVTCYGQVVLSIISRAFDNFSEFLYVRKYSQIPYK